MTYKEKFDEINDRVSGFHRNMSAIDKEIHALNKKKKALSRKESKAIRYKHLIINECFNKHKGNKNAIFHQRFNSITL